jgi:hypothetical protein
VNAIKGLPNLSKDKPDLVSQIADVLGQLFSEDDKLELDIIRNAFLAVFRIDIKNALKSLFNQIALHAPGKKDADPRIRERMIQFLQDKVLANFKQLVSTESIKDVESIVSAEIVKLLSDCSEEEYGKFLKMLNQLALYEDAEGAKKFVQVVMDASPLKQSQEFNPTELVKLNKVLSEMNTVQTHFEKTNTNQPFFNFLVHQVLPHFSSLDDRVRLQILRQIAIASPYTPGTDARNALPIIYQHLVDGIPLSTGSSETKPEINFSYLECILYSFHQLAQKAPGALNKVCGIKIVTGQPYDDMGDYTEKRRDMIARLQYLENQSREYLKRVNELKKAAQKPKEGETKTEETDGDKQTQQALLDEKQAEFTRKVISNLERMSRNLSSNKHTFLTPRQVDLSWRPRGGKKPETATSSGQATKRGAPPSEDQPPTKKTRELYKTPSQRGESRETTTDSGKRGGRRGGRGGRRGGRK